MLSRCTYSYNPSYSRYGGRGIKVCERWLKFENFLEDMGVRPPGTCIERDNSDLDYTPSNCSWASTKTQGKEKQKLFTHAGKTMSLTAWAAEKGMSLKTLSGRMNKYGMSFDQAISKKV